MRLILTLAALAVLAPTASLAQPRPQPGHGMERRDDRHDAKPRPRPRKLSHAQLCRERFRSYNPRTDRYTLRPGVTRRCTL